jgi:alpha/beta superfamily hydrolase
MPKVYIQGSAGKIEGMYSPSESENAPIVLVLHPHPLYGGTMNNKITYGMAKKFSDMGFSVLRINMRGVGNSDGTFSNGIGELDDAGAALDWLMPSRTPPYLQVLSWT